MFPFEYHKKTKIIFGKGERKRIGELAASFGKNILLVHSGDPDGALASVAEAASDAIKEHGASCIKLSGVLPNPRLSLVRQGIALCVEYSIDFICAVGGGSSIDTAKAIASGIYYHGDVWDFYTGKAVPEKAVPVGCLLTIPAAGSESSDGSVITNEEEKRKMTLLAECIVPQFAILDPELCLTLPEYQRVCGIFDIITHVMERYFTHTPRTDLIDRLCEATIRTVIENARRLSRNPKDVDAWGEIMLAGNFAHNAFLGSGREQDWSSHEIEHELSAIYDIAHGAGLAIVFPAWMRYVCREDAKVFAQFAARVFDVELSFDDIEEIAFEGIRRLESFLRELGLPVTLSGAGIPSDSFEKIAANACRNGSLGNFKKLSACDVVNILESAK